MNLSALDGQEYEPLIHPGEVHYMWVDKDKNHLVSRTKDYSSYLCHPIYFFGMDRGQRGIGYNFSHKRGGSIQLYYLGFRAWTNAIQIHLEKRHTIERYTGRDLERYVEPMTRWFRHFVTERETFTMDRFSTGLFYGLFWKPTL